MKKKNHEYLGWCNNNVKCGFGEFRFNGEKQQVYRGEWLNDKYNG